ncbi:1 3-beta-glucanosyltransferase gel2 [Rhizina undulata]
MKGIVFTTLAASLAHVVSAVHPVVVKGHDFVDSVTGDRFVLVGVAYQPAGASGYDPNSGTDPLSDGDICLRDASLMQKLGINTIRVYTVNPDVNHDTCMSIFNDVGIYVALDVNSPLSGESLNRADPAGSYTKDYLERIFSVVDAFSGYPNLLGFFAGNEVVNDQSSANIVPPYIRAIQRDLKNYIAAHASRTIPVGYSAADDPTRRAMWAYLSCGTDTGSMSDFFGLNSYQWCGDSTWETSGYQGLVDTYSDTSIPLFFSEFGCNTVRPRVFNEIGALYGTQMIGAWSGGLVYEYSQEASDYGLVELSSNGTATLLTDYDNLQAKYNAIDLSLLTTANTSSTAHPACTTSFILDSYTGTSFNTSMTLPACPATDLITSGSGNTNVGKIVDVTTLTSTYTAISTSGKVIDLTISPLPQDESNTPSGQNTSGSATGSSSSSSTTHKGMASRGGASLGLAVVVAMVAALIL